MRPGQKNNITDVNGILVGHATDQDAMTGSTVFVFEQPVVASVDIRGGGPASRDTELLNPVNTVDEIDAISMSGGSAFGLDASGGVQDYLVKQGRGLNVGHAIVPIVPGAAIFDLLNEGDKTKIYGNYFWELGRQAAQNANIDECRVGRIGAGIGATIASQHKKGICFGGYGSASTLMDNGMMIGACAIVNPAGSPFINGTNALWAAPLGLEDEFKNHSWPDPLPANSSEPITKGTALNNTTLGIVATNAKLTKAQCQRLAIMAQTGLARALYPVHTPLDGDIVFAISTGNHDLDNPISDLVTIGALAANTLARAIGHAVASNA